VPLQETREAVWLSRSGDYEKGILVPVYSKRTRQLCTELFNGFVLKIISSKIIKRLVEH
jgi:hypothetical protein